MPQWNPFTRSAQADTDLRADSLWAETGAVIAPPDADAARWTPDREAEGGYRARRAGHPATSPCL